MQRDNKITDLEQSIFTHIKSIIEPMHVASDVGHGAIADVGLEAALRELLEMEKSQRDGTTG